MVPDDPFHEPEPDPAAPAAASASSAAPAAAAAPTQGATATATTTSTSTSTATATPATSTPTTRPLRPALTTRTPSGILQSSTASSGSTPPSAGLPSGDDNAITMPMSMSTSSPRRGRPPPIHVPPPDGSPARKPSRHAHFNLAALPSINPVVPRSSGPATATATALPGSATASASGSGTPHRVQWTQDRVIDMEPEGNGDAQSGGQRRRKGGWYEHTTDEEPEPHAGEPDLARVNSALETYSRTHRRSSTATSVSSNTGEDYDYRLDNDPVPDDDELYDDSHAHAQAEGDENQRRGNEESRLHALLDSAAASHVHGGYVQLGETDGLPSRPDESEHKSELRAAADLVRSHTGNKWGRLRQRVRSGSVRRHGAGAGHGHSAADRDTSTGTTTATDLEKQPIMEEEEEEHTVPSLPANSINQPLNAPPGVTGNSVLSALLALHHHQSQPESAPVSAPESTVTTPQSSRPPSPSPDEPPSAHRRHFWQRAHGRHGSGTAPPPNSGAASGTPGGGSFSDKDHSGKASPSIADRDTSPRGPHFLHSLSRYVEELRDDRPKAARSGAGVFGALIQSTSGMAAAAVPPASTLMPSAKRPGYHLTRYSLAEEPPSPRFKPPSRPNSFTTLRHSHSGDTPPHIMTRPNSTTALNSLKDDAGDSTSRPASLYSTYTDVADKDREHAAPAYKSSDNLVMMKSKTPGKKTSVPNPLNLKAVKSAETWLTGKSYEDLQRIKEEEKRKKELAAEKRRKKKAREARKKQEVYIIRHVAAIIARQQFILKLARALMMFGSPTHRIETQIQATAKVLDISAQVVYLPNIMLVSFSDEAMHTSETKFVKQASTVDLGKLLATHNLYWEVVHDRMSVEDANKELDHLMTVRPLYSLWQMLIIGAFCSANIVIPSYYGSFLDALMAAPLGMLLILVQTLAAKNDLFSGVFEITIATFISFLAAALGDTRYFCYTALVSGGIVMILPGYIVLTGALELASRNITAGAVRMGYSVIYSLFLGFGISMGAEIYMKIRHLDEITNATDYMCTATHYKGAPWYMSTPSGYWYYLAVPAFSFFLSLSNQQPIFRLETPVMMAFACAGWVVNHFASTAFSGRSDIVSAIGSFCVGLLGNIYGRFFSNGASFPVMVTGILMQLPSGLKEGGLFNFAADTKQGTFTQYSTGFSVAAQLVSVAIGLTVGLFAAAVITNPLGGSRRRGNAIFTF